MAWSGTPSIQSWSAQQGGSIQLRIGANQVQPMTVILPAPPFTVETTARFSRFSAGPALWGILLNIYSKHPSSVLLSNDRHYFAPFVDMSAFYYRLHPAGQFNQIILTAQLDGQATLALNGEAVWKGPLIFDPTNGQWALFAANSYPNAAVFTWLVTLYRPPPKNE